VYVILVRKNGQWVDWTSTANRERLQPLVSLARISRKDSDVRWERR
jgi:hypothetical protein